MHAILDTSQLGRRSSALVLTGWCAALACGQMPANPELYGTWSAPAALNPAETPEDDSMQAVHSILLHVGNGRVLCLGIEEIVVPPQLPPPNVVLFDPATAQTSIVTSDGDWPSYGAFEHVLFCSGHVVRHDGSILFGGGGFDTPFPTAITSLYLPAASGVGTFVQGPTEDWSGSADPTERWYPTLTALGDGNVLVMDGAVPPAPPGNPTVGRPNVPVIFKSTLASPFNFTGWEPLETAEYGRPAPPYEWDLPFYPFMFLLSDGDVFLAGGHYFDLGNPGSQPLVSRRLDPSLETWTDLASIPPIKGGSAVKLRYRNDPDPIKDLVMIAGGGLTGHQGASCDDNVASSGAASIDFTAATPTWSALPSMAHARIHFYLIALPDGTVLAVGGVRGDGPGGTLPPLCDPSNDILEPEIYNPYSNTWSPMASMATPRLYHSSAVLLRDGSIFVAGGQREFGGSTTRYRNYEIFKPPYFFRYAQRPTITTSPVAVGYNKGFDVETPNATSAASVTKVRLIRTGAATHSFDHNARMLELEFSVKQTEPEKLRVKSPQHGDLAPPGYYLLYICTGANGQNPSEGAFIKLNPISGIPPGGGP